MQTETTKPNPFAVVSLLLGVVSMMPFCLSYSMTMWADSGTLPRESAEVIVSILGGLGCLSFLTMPIALIFSVVARKQIQAKGGLEKGSRLALTGAILAGIAVAINACGAISLLLR